MAGLAPSFGRGAMTNAWVDIKNADLVFVMGGNPAEAHPCGFKWAIEARTKRKAKIVVVDPRFTRTAAVADIYAPLRPGTDITFLGGLIHYLLANNKIHEEYVKNYTNAAYIVNPEYSFKDGLFSGFDEATKKYTSKATWTYEMKNNLPVIDPTLQNPRCVINMLKDHYKSYTPEMVEKLCGTPQDLFKKICETIAETSAPNKAMSHLYALGWTQHTVGSQNIRSMAIIQLLLGNMGKAGGGINALRGHSNVQGLTDLGLLAHLLPGYLGIPMEADQTRKEYLEKRTLKPIIPGQMNYWQNFPKFYTSLMKSWFGDNANAQNDFAFDMIPKPDKSYDVLTMMDLMFQGKMNGFICQGFNPLAAVPHKKRLIDGLSKLKFLVTIDPLVTETSVFWENHGEFNDVNTASIKTEVFRLPACCFAEDEGSFTNSSRCVQWFYKAADPPGEGKTDIEIMADLFLRLKSMYQKEPGALADPIMNLTWNYKQPKHPSPEELAKEINGYALVDIVDPKDKTKILAKQGELLPTFALMKDDGTTSGGCWIYTGVWTEKGNQSARRDLSDPSGLGIYASWGWAWPANRRILYNRASCDLNGKPFDPSRTLIKWNGTKWVGFDVPDYRADAKPEEKIMPFIMTQEGVARLFATDKMAEGPFPTHYEPIESPLDNNPLAPKSKSNPATRIFKMDTENIGTSKEFPFVGTTYRLTEHFHFWTKHAHSLAVVQPEFFVEIGEELAKEKGITQGGKVKVTSKRGAITAKAVVTKRIPTYKINGKSVHVVGIPLHWGFVGLTKKGYLANTLTPFWGDANTQTPEFKAFLVNIEKA